MPENKPKPSPPISAYSKKIKKPTANDPIFTLPPYKVEGVFTTMSETIDWGIEICGIPGLWRQTRGEGIKVAVLDTGIAFEHPDLRDAIADAKDFTNSRSGPADVQGHGTHCAGTIAARQNSTGVIGVAPECKLLVGKVLGDNGSGSSNSVAAGVRWAADAGANLISMSLGSSMDSPDIYQAIKEVTDRGVFVIAAAGNEGPQLGTVGYPGRYEEVIAVGAIDRRKGIARFSSRGPQVDIVAPGDEILSTYPPRNLAKLSGTSMATPLVAGVVALMLAKHNIMGSKTTIQGVGDLKEHLTRCAVDLGPTGFDQAFGFGLIDPVKLLANISPGQLGPTLAALMLVKDDLSETGKRKLEKLLVEFGSMAEVDIKLST